MTTIDVSLVAVSWNTVDHLPAALDSVRVGCGDLRSEIIVVDNASTDASREVLRARSDVRLIELDDNYGFTHAANLGARAATGEHLLFLNPDVTLHDGAVVDLVAALRARPDAWGATPWFRNPDGTAQRFWLRLPGWRSALLAYTRWGRALDRRLGGRCQAWRHYADLPDPPGTVEIDAVGAACLLVRRAEFLDAGAFDERFFNFFQDGDFARRMQRRGRPLLGVGSTEVTHVVGVTIRKLPVGEREGQFLHAYRQFLAGEPAARRWLGNLSVRLDVLLPRPDRAAVKERALRPLDVPR